MSGSYPICVVCDCPIAPNVMATTRRGQPRHEGCEDKAPHWRELEARQNELYHAMGVVEQMPASEAQTACIVALADRMRLLVEKLGKSEVGRRLQ